MIKKPGKTTCAALLLALLAASGSASAGDEASASAWIAGANSQARLLAAGPPVDGIYLAGIEVALKGQAHTYWRQPGDAGVPPTVSFLGSRNVKQAALRYPAPMRLDEGGLQVFGYRNGVLLPLEVEPEDPAAPVHLAVSFSYAACEKICIPAEASAALDLTPEAAPAPEAERLAQARAALPQRHANGEKIELSARAEVGTDKPLWHLRIARPEGPWRDIFAEGPEGWFIETRATPEGFDLIAAERPSDAHLPVPVTLTLAGVRDYEVRIDLAGP